MKIFSDRPWLAIMLLVALYWLTFPLLPKPNGSNALAVLAVCSGIFLLFQYLGTFLEILFKGERRQGWIAVLFVSCLAIGIIISGGYTLVFNKLGQPKELISSATANFGRAILIVSCFGLGISHELTRMGDGSSRGVWRAFLIIAAIVVAFVAGSHFSNL